MTYEQRIRQELERVHGTGEWIRVHCLPEDLDAFEVVRVLGIGEETIAADSVDTFGRPNGSRSIALGSVVGLTTGGYYLENLRALRDAAPTKTSVPISGDGHEGVLRAAQAAELVVSILMTDETIQGYVREVGDGWTAIAQIEENEGGDDGVRIVSLDDAERVFVGGEDEIRLTILARARRLKDSIG